MLFTIAISLIILIAMKLIFVTKNELQNKFDEFKLDVLKSIDERINKFTEVIQKFIDASMKEKFVNISKQNIDTKVSIDIIMDKLTNIEQQIKK